MKKIIFVLLSLLSVSCFAENNANPLYNDVMSRSCPNAFPTTDPNFCKSFETAANCHCKAHGLPDNDTHCKSMNYIYDKMIAVHHTVEEACDPHFQSDTSQQECIDDWNCYRNGGTNSAGNLCSGTGKACQ